MDQTAQDFKMIVKTDIDTAVTVVNQWWQAAKLPKKDVFKDELPQMLRASFKVKDRLDEAMFTMELKVKEESGATVIYLNFLYNIFVRSANDVLREVVCGLASEFKKRSIECEVRTGFLLRKKYEC